MQELLIQLVVQMLCSLEFIISFPAIVLITRALGALVSTVIVFEALALTFPATSV